MKVTYYEHINYHGECDDCKKAIEPETGPGSKTRYFADTTNQNTIFYCEECGHKKFVRDGSLWKIKEEA